MRELTRRVLAEHVSHGRILSTDARDAHAYRWKQYAQFQNLLLTSPQD